MKKVMLILLLGLIGGNGILFAQQNEDKRRADFEKFRAERKAFITKEMALTDEEAAAFWPLNDELQRKKFELNREVRSQMHALRQAKREGKKISDEEYKKLMESSAKVKVKEAELDEIFQKKFLEILPAEKVFKLQNAENEFARKTMDNRQRKPQHSYLNLESGNVEVLFEATLLSSPYCGPEEPRSLFHGCDAPCGTVHEAGCSK